MAVSIKSIFVVNWDEWFLYLRTNAFTPPGLILTTQIYDTEEKLSPGNWNFNKNLSRREIKTSMQHFILTSLSLP